MDEYSQVADKIQRATMTEIVGAMKHELDVPLKILQDSIDVLGKLPTQLIHVQNAERVQKALNLLHTVLNRFQVDMPYKTKESAPGTLILDIGEVNEPI